MEQEQTKSIDIKGFFKDYGKKSLVFLLNCLGVLAIIAFVLGGLYIIFLCLSFQIAMVMIDPYFAICLIPTVIGFIWVFYEYRQEKKLKNRCNCEE